MTKTILNALKDITSDPQAPGQTWVQPYQPKPDPLPHQFVVFFKPESTALHEGVDVEGILQLASNTLDEWGVQTGAVRIMRGDYLQKHRLLDRHYGVINEIAHQGRSAISQAAELKLQDLFAKGLSQGVEVIGAYPLLEKYPDLSPFALCALADNLVFEKLAGGTYAFTAKVGGCPYIILNGFHPYQLVPYYNPSAAIVVMECSSDRPWADLRTNLAGATDPRKAEAGSIRNQLFLNQEKLNLADASPGTNGIHLSAGPLEGLAELQRFFADHENDVPPTITASSFGQRLAGLGLEPEQIVHLTTNPDFDLDGKLVSAFDLTEEIDAEESAEKLAAQIPQLKG